MNNSVLFVNPLDTIQLLSMLSHINILSDFLYGKNVLSKNDQFKSIPIVNSLYDYFDENNNNLETRTNLVHKLLDGSDLYGAKRNDSVDSDYVNAVLGNIIRNIVFKKYGNIYGFLAGTMISTEDPSLSFFKEKIRIGLRTSNHTNEDGSTSHLSDLAIRKISEELIFPLFPKAENNTSVVFPDYIYAQAGLAFARAAKIDLDDITFDELVDISQTIELSVHEGQLNETVLSIFALPATLYYSNSEKTLLKEKTIASVVTDSDYWVTVYEHLFTYLDSTFTKLQKTVKKAEAEHPEYQFKVALSHYKTRTQLAEENIRIHCPLENDVDYGNAVDAYKYNPKKYYCKEKDMTLPNVNELFDMQNEDIARKYVLMEKKLIKDAFGATGIQLINEQNVTIYESRAIYSGIRPHHLPIKIYAHKIKDSADLLEAYQASTKNKDFFALVREDDKIILIKGFDLDYLCEKIGIGKGSVFGRTSTVLKSSTDIFDTFAARIAKKRADHLKSMLHEKGYKETSWEKAVRILSHFVPFYNCIDNLIQWKPKDAAIDCSLDAVTLIPLYGAVVNIGAKIISKSLLLGLGTSIRTVAYRESIYVALCTIGKGVISQAAVEFSHVFTRQMFQSISISLLRALDPGLEFLVTLTQFGIKSTIRLVFLIKKQFSPSLYKKILSSLQRLKNSVKSIRIGQYRGHDLHVNSVSGTSGFGHKYISTPVGNYELRIVRDHRNEVPVQLVNVKNGKNIYRRVSLEAGETSGPELELKNNILQPIVPALSVRLKNILATGLSGRGAISAARKFYKDSKLEEFEKALNILKRANIDEEQARKVFRDHLLESVGRTPFHLATHWVSTSNLPPWISELKISEANLFWKLRYQEILSLNEINLDVAIARIKEIYGESEMQKICVNMGFVIEIFNVFNSRVNIVFEDLYAIFNYGHTGFLRIHEDTDEARRMQNAFYRLVVRQVDDFENLPIILHRGETRDSIASNSFIEGSEIEINKFTLVTRDKVEARLSFRVCRNNRPLSSVNVLYEIQLDSSIFTADIEKVNPLEDGRRVLIPGTKLLIVSAEDVTIDGIMIKKLTVRNGPVDKSQWLIQLMRKIKELKESGTQFYYDAL